MEFHAAMKMQRRRLLKPRGQEQPRLQERLRLLHLTWQRWKMKKYPPNCGRTSRIFRSWDAMMQRCYTETHHAYNRYGGKGVVVCERWKSYENFIADMFPRPEGKCLDRFPHGNGHYEPTNCRWATWEEQNRNRSNSRLISFHGETFSLAEWAERQGLRYGFLADRIRRGWSPERALLTPKFGPSRKGIPQKKSKRHPPPPPERP